VEKEEVTAAEFSARVERVS